jgi:hypothetical protein
LRGGFVGLFGKLFKKNDDMFGSDAPPDFSQPFSPSSSSNPKGSDPFGGDVYGQHPLENNDPFNSGQSAGYGDGGQNAGYGSGGQNAASGQNPDSAFSHDIFSSQEPTNADRARSYAQGLGQQPGNGAQGSATATYAGAITGHEMQLVLERLDTIKAELDSIKQRMIRVDRYLEQSEQKKRYI